jgi:uroporphyrinogen decarboxylase
MMTAQMTSFQRVLTTLGHQEPDRVPLFLLLTLHGAKELGLTIPEYFSKAENVVEGQLRLRARYHHDCFYSFFYAPIEIEAWGGEVVYYDDGPPNSGQPFIRNAAQIKHLQPPRVSDSPRLMEVIKSIQMLKARAGADAPIIGVAVSPFSLPVMQMGFDHYLDLIYDSPDLFECLMQINEEFCVEWANAQVDAGATAIAYFDPVSSPTIIPRDLFLQKGFPVARRTLARIHGATAYHFASGQTLPILEDVIRLGANVVGVSAHEDLAAVKAMCKGRLTVLGNLNGIEMRRWTPAQAEAIVKEAIFKAAPGGGFILSDNHGEIPFNVPDDVLMAISEAVQRWGRYPITES